MTAMSRCYPFRVRIKKTQSMILLVSCVIILINVMHKPYNIIRENLAFEIARCSACGYINKTTPFGNSSFTRLDVVDFISKTSFVSVIAILERIKQRLGRQRHYDETGQTVCGYPKELAGYFAVDFNASLSYHGNTLFTDVKPGGIWTPSKCVAIQRTAFIIPYRDRERHLQTLLYYLVPMLKRQQIDFQIFVVEQYGKKVFNKGMLLNAGFLEAWSYGDFDCFVFHDVDLVPVNDKNMYTCEVYPKHMSPDIDIDNNELPYVMLVGGVLSMTPEIYIALNGYSNLYWGWGGEDDDMAFSMQESKLGVIRPPPTIGIGTSSVSCNVGLSKKGFPHECTKSKHNTIVVKTHRIHELKGMQKAVLLIRNPYEAFQAFSNFRKAGFTGHVYNQTLVKEANRMFNESCNWYLDLWNSSLNLNISVYILQYEKLKSDMQNELRGLAKFLNVNITEADIKCTVKLQEGLYHRNTSDEARMNSLRDIYDDQKLNVLKSIVSNTEGFLEERFHRKYDIGGHIQKVLLESTTDKTKIQLPIF